MIMIMMDLIIINMISCFYFFIIWRKKETFDDEGWGEGWFYIVWEVGEGLKCLLLLRPFFCVYIISILFLFLELKAFFKKNSIHCFLVQQK